MATPEQELQTYRAIASKFNSTPELKSKYLRLYKEAFPQADVPEVDVPDALEAKLRERDEANKREIEELKQRLYKKEFEDSFEKKREALSGPPWFLDESNMAQVDELVEKKGFPSLELAADYLRATAEPLKPSSLGLSGFTPTKDALSQRKEFNDRYKKIFKKNKNNFQETFDDAYNKAFVTGEYLKDMGKR